MKYWTDDHPLHETILLQQTQNNSAETSKYFYDIIIVSCWVQARSGHRMGQQPGLDCADINPEIEEMEKNVWAN